METKREIMLSTEPAVERAMEEAIAKGAPFMYGPYSIEIRNFKRFYDFINRSHRGQFIDVEECLKQVLRGDCDHTEKGSSELGSYELGRYETTTGHAETIDYDYLSDYDEELDEISNEMIVF